MAIDYVALARELAGLRELAAQKVRKEPLPTDRDAQRHVREEVHRLGLASNILDLETKGYTVLPPGSAAPTEFCDRLRDTILAIAEKDCPFATDPGRPRGHLLWHLLPRDQIFEQALMAERPLALVAYLLGYRAKLSQCTGIVKDETSTEAFQFHADQSRKIPAPWPSDAQFCTVTWVLSDYTRENGSVCVLPGTHKLCRDVPDEMVLGHDHPDVVPVEAQAGSVIVWHGALWHGAFPRSSPGQRVSLAMPMVRFHLLAQELFWASTAPEMIERNSSRFAALMGLVGSWPWGVDGPDTGYERPSWLTTRCENRFA